MLWTEQAVEILKRLALEGKSASAIALALGAASRGAVIGKANRIGVRLNGDGRAYVPGSAPAGAYRRQPAAVPRPSRAHHHGEDPQTALSGDSAINTTEGRKAWVFAGAEVGEMQRVTFANIRESACRWPLGDPRSGDFAYCGLPPAESRSYCAGHCRMAYRPPAASSRSEPRSSQPRFANMWRSL
jgi:GcrA cell cycle regulator